MKYLLPGVLERLAVEAPQAAALAAKEAAQGPGALAGGVPLGPSPGSAVPPAQWVEEPGADEEALPDMHQLQRDLDDLFAGAAAQHDEPRTLTEGPADTATDKPAAAAGEAAAAARDAAVAAGEAAAAAREAAAAAREAAAAACEAAAAAREAAAAAEEAAALPPCAVHAH